MKPFLFDCPLLPDNFKFPEEYSVAAIKNILPEIEPWQFLAKDMATSLSYYGTLMTKFPDEPLIPFAIIDDESGVYNEGWVVLACFDGKDNSGTPKVFIYDFSTPKISPWENLTYDGFSDWLSAAREESRQYLDEQDEF